jgi:hypothetical protein
MVHTAVVLPRDLLDHLRTAAEASGQKLSSEIRRRLQQFDGLEVLEAARDVETRELMDMLENLPTNLAADLGRKWYEHAYALAALKAGIAALLAQYTPPGDGNVRPDVRVFGEHDDPAEVVGRTHARSIWISRGRGAKFDADVKNR